MGIATKAPPAEGLDWTADVWGRVVVVAVTRVVGVDGGSVLVMTTWGVLLLVVVVVTVSELLVGLVVSVGVPVEIAVTVLVSVVWGAPGGTPVAVPPRLLLSLGTTVAVGVCGPSVAVTVPVVS